MPEWFTGLAAIIALGGGVFGAVNGYRTMKRSSPVEEVRKENLDKWRNFYNDKWDKTIERLDRIEEIVESFDGNHAHERFERIDEKLDNDHRRINIITDNIKSQQKFLVLLLKAQHQSLAHLADGNHKTALMQVSDEIQEFLLNEATRCNL